MGKPHKRIAGGKLRYWRIYRFRVPDGDKVVLQNFDRRDSTCGVALQPAGLDQLARRHDACLKRRAALPVFQLCNGHTPAG